MRTIIAGSRSITDYSLVELAVELSGILPTVIISGGARGIDSLGERYAKEHNIPLEVYPADWARYGRAAGRRRNAVMAEKAEALIALWDGESPGTNNMIKLAEAMKLQVKVYTCEL